MVALEVKGGRYRADRARLIVVAYSTDNYGYSMNNITTSESLGANIPCPVRS